MSDNRVYLFDSTLRDGAQTQGIDFSAADKVVIAEELDRLGIDYVEGGWPGANPTDDAFFAAPPKFARARLTAFGMTRRVGRCKRESATATDTGVIRRVVDIDLLPILPGQGSRGIVVARGSDHLEHVGLGIYFDY
jgi:hypothetical protein